jgi:NADH-quinone oxidoreductase subunit F
MIQNKEVLEQIREEAVKELNSYDCRILVCSGTGCVATGSQKIYEKFMEIAKDAPGVTIEFGPHDKDAHVGVKKTGCQGERRRCDPVYEGSDRRLPGDF